MHNFCTKYGKFLDICKQFSKNPLSELRNIFRKEIIPKKRNLRW